MFDDYDEDRVDVVRWALKRRLIPLLNAPKTGYIDRRTQQLGTLKSAAANTADTLAADVDSAAELTSVSTGSPATPNAVAASSLPPAPLALSAEQAQALRAAAKIKAGKKLTKGQKRSLRAAATIAKDMLSETETLSMGKSVVATVASTEHQEDHELAEWDLADESDPVASVPDVTAASAPAAVGTYDMLSMFALRKAADVVSWYKGNDIAKVTDRKLLKAEQIVTTLSDVVLKQKLTCATLSSVVEALEQHVTLIQGGLSELRDDLEVDDDGQLEAIMRTYANASKWFKIKDERIQTVAKAVILFDALLAQLPEDKQDPAWHTYDNIKMQFISDMFRVVWEINFDALCAAEMVAPRQLAATPGEAISNKILSCIEQLVKFELPAASTDEMALQLSLLIDAVANTVGEEQKTVEGKRFLSDRVANSLSLFMPGALVTPPNGFLKDLSRLLAEHKQKITDLQRASSKVRMVVTG